MAVKITLLRLTADSSQAAARAEAAKEAVRVAKSELKAARKTLKSAKKAAKRARKELDAAAATGASDRRTQRRPGPQSARKRVRPDTARKSPPRSRRTPAAVADAVLGRTAPADEQRAASSEAEASQAALASTLV